MEGRILSFLDSTPRNKEELKKTKPSKTNYRKYYTKQTKIITSYSQESWTIEQEILKSVILQEVLEN